MIPGNAKISGFFAQSSDFAASFFAGAPCRERFRCQRFESTQGRTTERRLSMRWASETNKFGALGVFVGDTNKKGSGAHGSLSRTTCTTHWWPVDRVSARFRRRIWELHADLVLFHSGGQTAPRWMASLTEALSRGRDANLE